MRACCGASSRSCSNVAPGRSAWVLRITGASLPMLDIALIRRDPERVRESALRRGGDPTFVDRVLELDAAYRRALTAVEALKAEKNGLTAAISRAADRAAAARELRPRIAALDAQIGEAAGEPSVIEAQIAVILSEVPNILDPAVPAGTGSEDNVVA